MRYVVVTVEGGWDKLQLYLNSLPPTSRVISITPGNYGKWHGLAEEYEFGFKVVVDGYPVEISITNNIVHTSGDGGCLTPSS